MKTTIPKQRKVATVTPEPSTPVEGRYARYRVNDALVMCDAITLRLGKLASIAGMVSKIAMTMQETDKTDTWTGIEVLADALVAELERISNDVSSMYEAGGAK